MGQMGQMGVSQNDLQTFPISSVRTESNLSVKFEARPSVSVNVNRRNNKKLHLTYFYLRNSLTVFNVENHCSASNRRRLRDATASKTFDEFRKKFKANSHEDLQIISMDWTLDIFMLFFLCELIEIQSFRIYQL